MLKTLVFDTETTGFAKYKAPLLDKGQPRLVQLGAYYGEVFYDEKLVQPVPDDPMEVVEPIFGRVRAQIDTIIYPEIGDVSWTIPEKAQSAHGISTEDAKEWGVLMEGPLLQFYDMIVAADLIVAHNAVFDVHVIKCALALLKEQEPVIAEEIDPTILDKKKVYCTLIGAKALPDITYRGTKGPNLQSLHTQLIGYEFEGAHSAIDDVAATWRCFCRMDDFFKKQAGTDNE